MRWDPGLLRVPQDLAKQTGLGDCLPGGLGRPKHDEQRRLRRQTPGFRRIASPDEREPVGQGTGRLGRELDNRTLAPGHPKLHGHLAVSTPDDIPERQRTPRWGRSPTSPSSRMVALSRAPTAVVRSGSTNRRSYWAGEMVAGGVPAAGRWTGWRPARGSRPGGQVGAGHHIRAAATPTTTPRHRGRRRSPAGRSSGPGPRR